MVEASNLRKSYGDRVLIDDLTFLGTERGIVGIISLTAPVVNRLFRMMSGQNSLMPVPITPGETVKLASVDQFRDAMITAKPSGKKSPAGWIS